MSIIEQANKPKCEHKARYKRPMDLSILIVSHIVLAPVLMIFWGAISSMIWLEDRGPILFRQDRSGKDGRIISIIKFRTMVPDAARVGPVWTVKDDPRITRTGRWLRKTGLDELPQLVSLWKGDVSFVGPRPLPVHEQDLLESEIPGFEERLTIQPGLTGLAQIYNHGDGDQGKLNYDLEYIRRRGLLLDVKLILMTGLIAITGRGDDRLEKTNN